LLLAFSLFWENFEELSVAKWKHLFKVSYLVSQNCSVELFMIGCLSFPSKIDYTTASFVLCLYFIQVLLIEWGFVGDIDTEVVYSLKPTYLDSACV